MAAKMDPVKIRQKLVEVADTIKRMEQDGIDPREIQIERRKEMVLKKWLEDAEKLD